MLSAGAELPAWEQRKLGELLSFQNGFNGSSSSFSGVTPLISVMDVLADGFIFSDSVKGQVSVDEGEAERYSVVYGDVLFQRSSENQEDAGTSNVYLDHRKRSVFGGFVIRGRALSAYDPVCMKHLLLTSPIRRQIVSRAQGAQHINVSQDVLEGVELAIPPLPEQRAIGSFFSTFESLITLHQRKW